MTKARSRRQEKANALLAVWVSMLGHCRVMQYNSEPEWALAAVEVEKVVREQIEKLGSAVPATSTAWIIAYRRLNGIPSIRRRRRATLVYAKA